MSSFTTWSVNNESLCSLEVLVRCHAAASVNGFVVFRSTKLFVSWDQGHRRPHVMLDDSRAHALLLLYDLPAFTVKKH